jgi:TolB-like protein
LKFQPYKQYPGSGVIPSSILTDNPLNLKKYIAELKKRHVFKAGLAYLIGAWVFSEVAALVLDSFEAPPYIMKTILVVLIVGLPVWLVFSWVYDLTPDGIKKTSAVDQKESKSPVINQRLNRAIILFMSVAIILLIGTHLWKNPGKIAQQGAITDRSIENNIELIAVLPFFNNRSDPETDYLGFAMADQIIGGLVYLQNITVRPSASIRQYEQRSIDPKEVGDELQVDFVLIGNYLKEGNTIRLNVELINVKANRIIWRKPIEVDFHSAFELQDLVAQEVIDGMNVQFTQKELNRIRKDIPKDPLAYEYFLRSISIEYTNEGDRLAIALLEKSIELDSTFAPAYNQLGDRLRKLALYSLLSPEERTRGENALLRALYLNSEHIGALGNLAMAYTETNRTMEAVELIKKILEINPNSAEAHFSLGYLYRYAGLNEAAILEMEKAVAIDAKNQGYRSIIVTYFFAGEFEKAIDAGSLFEESAFILLFQGLAYLSLGMKTEALECFNRVIQIDPGNRQAISSGVLKAFIEGDIEAGISHAETYEQFDSGDAEAWYFISFLYGMLGEKEACIRCLRKAVEGGFFNYPLMSSDKNLDSVREEAAFEEILEDARIKHLAFKEMALN